MGALEAEWRALEASANASIFNSWHWITLLAVLPDTIRSSLLRGSAGGDTVALVLLGKRLTRRRSGLVRSRSVFPNETGDPAQEMTIEHNTLLVSAEHREAGAEALTRWFVRQRTAPDELHVSGSTQRFPECLVEARGLRRYGTAKPSYCVELSRLAENDGDVCPVLSSNARPQLRRALRRFAAAWDNRGIAHAFSLPFLERFHRLMIERGVRHGVVELLRTRAGDRIFGCLYNLRIGSRIYAYQNGFAYDDRLTRPGAVAHALAIREGYRSGAAIYDYLGRNWVKESFSTSCQPMLWQVIQQPRLTFRLEHTARRLNERLTAADPGGPSPQNALAWGSSRSTESDRDCRHMCALSI